MNRTALVYLSEGEDFVKVNETVEFKPGEDSVPVMIEIIDDDVLEDSELFDLILENPDKATVTMPEKAKVTIKDQGDQEPSETGSECHTAIAKISRQSYFPFFLYVQNLEYRSNTCFTLFRRLTESLLSKS